MQFCIINVVIIGSPGRTRTYNPPVTSSPYVSVRLGLSLYPVKIIGLRFPLTLPSPLKGEGTILYREQGNYLLQGSERFP